MKQQQRPVRLAVRVTPQLAKRIKELSKTERRPVNTQIVMLLERGLTT